MSFLKYHIEINFKINTASIVTDRAPVSVDFIDGKSTISPAMAWCCQVPCH